MLAIADSGGPVDLSLDDSAPPCELSIGSSGMEARCLAIRFEDPGRWKMRFPPWALYRELWVLPSRREKPNG